MFYLWEMDNVFRCFLFGYVAAGHTVDASASNDLMDLASQYVKDLHPSYYFSAYAVEEFIAYLQYHMSQSIRHFFVLAYDDVRYIEHLEELIKRWIGEDIRNNTIPDIYKFDCMDDE